MAVHMQHTQPHTKPMLHRVKPRVIAIVGPTASGKSELAVLLAQKINGEIISTDSRQVYRGLDIATGKITQKEMRGVPHHLLDVANPKKTYTVAQFKKAAEKTITDVVARGKTPIICGGTGFYIDALLLGQEFPEVKPDKKLRERLQTQSAEQLYKKLQKLDLRRAQEVDKHNKVRLIRAIEIAHALGTVPPIKNHVPYTVTWFGLKPDPDEMKQRIHDRVISRMKKGMVTEAKKLHKNNLSYKRMRELGLEYKHLADYLQQKISRSELMLCIEKDDIAYAKRQMTWFKRNTEITWIKPNETDKLLKNLA